MSFLFPTSWKKESLYGKALKQRQT
jgi:hypothetical protein